MGRVGHAATGSYGLYHIYISGSYGLYHIYISGSYGLYHICIFIRIWLQVARVVREGLPGDRRKQNISFMSYVFVTFAGPH
jgi:hypothetical protein